MLPTNHFYLPPRKRQIESGPHASASRRHTPLNPRWLFSLRSMLWFVLTRANRNIYVRCFEHRSIRQRLRRLKRSLFVSDQRRFRSPGTRNEKDVFAEELCHSL